MGVEITCQSKETIGRPSCSLSNWPVRGMNRQPVRANVGLESDNFPVQKSFVTEK